MLRVRDMPPGVRFCLVRNRHQFTMLRQDPERKYQFHVISHPWVNQRGEKFAEKEAYMNGQSYVKPVIRIQNAQT